MTLFKTRSLNLNEDPLFTTVDIQGDVLLTSGTYIIASVPVKGVYVQKFKSIYKNGTAPSNEIFNPETDIIFVYPNGYFGVQTTGGDVELEDPLIASSKYKQRQIQYVNDKIKN